MHLDAEVPGEDVSPFRVEKTSAGYVMVIARSWSAGYGDHIQAAFESRIELRDGMPKSVTGRFLSAEISLRDGFFDAYADPDTEHKLFRYGIGSRLRLLECRHGEHEYRWRVTDGTRKGWISDEDVLERFEIRAAGLCGSALR